MYILSMDIFLGTHVYMHIKLIHIFIFHINVQALHRHMYIYRDTEVHISSMNMDRRHLSAAEVQVGQSAKHLLQIVLLNPAAVECTLFGQ